MHGRKRVPPVVPTDAEVAKEAAKVKKYSQLVSSVLNKRQANERGEEAWKLTSVLLKLNPDFYSVWNFRREILLEKLESQDANEPNVFLDGELVLTEHAIGRNPKSYCAWHHRQWLASRFGYCNVDRELALCTKLLNADERNFHCWNYRRFIASLDPVDRSSSELAYSVERINLNFSNYSAWHLRSSLLTKLNPGTNRFVVEEFERVQQALFTEPEDQTGWFYHHWLVEKACSTGMRNDALTLEDVSALLEQEIEMCRELLQLEEGCKWPTLTLAKLLTRLAELAVKVDDCSKASPLLLESMSLYDELGNIIDTCHSGYYLRARRCVEEILAKCA